MRPKSLIANRFVLMAAICSSKGLFSAEIEWENPLDLSCEDSVSLEFRDSELSEDFGPESSLLELLPLGILSFFLIVNRAFFIFGA